MKLSKCLKGNKINNVMIMNDVGCLVYGGNLEHLEFTNNDFYNEILNMKVINFYVSDDKIFTTVEE